MHAARRRILVGPLAFASAFLVAETANADDAPTERRGFGIERLRLPLSADPLLFVESGTAQPRGSWQLSTWLGWQDDPLVLEQGGRRLGALVAYRASLDVVASYAILDGLELGLDIPVVLAQDRATATSAATGGLASIQGVGVQDLRLSAKIAWPGASAHGFALAGRLSVTAPTAGAGDYRGDPGISIAPEVDLGGVSRGIHVAATAGYRWRHDTARFAGVTVDDEVYADLALGYRPMPRWEPAIGLSLSTAAGDATTSRDRDHVELLAGVGWHPAITGIDLVVTAMGGGGFAHGVGTPDARAVIGVRIGRVAPPVRHDPDHDGLRDGADRCPEDPEDHDGFEDGDGCSEPDNDGDGVLDFEDVAPNDSTISGDGGTFVNVFRSPDRARLLPSPEQGVEIDSVPR